MSDASAALLNLAASSTCLGTRYPIDLRQTVSHGSPLIGMLSTFSCQQEGKSPYLLVLVTNGKSTFQGRIHPSEASKVQWESHVSDEETKNADIADATKVKILSSFLLQDEDRIAVSYDCTGTPDDERKIKLVIRETLSSGIVRILWSHVLESTENNLVFSAILGTCVNESRAQIQQWKREKEKLRTDLWSWKDTAEKLDRDWQSEKDGLLNRFLELYKKNHEELGKSRLEVQCLKRELAEAQAASSTSATKKRVIAAPPPPPVYANMPDDHDEEEFDSEMVDMLATGQPTRAMVPVRERSNGRGTQATSSSALLGTMRLNPHTGAKEVFDADTALEDPAFLGLSSQHEGAIAPSKRNSEEEPGADGESPAKRARLEV